MASRITQLDPNKIRTDGGTQVRDAINALHVKEIRESLQSGGQVPPIGVIYDGTHYWLWDGFHRLDAHIANGSAKIEAFVEPGTRNDAVLKAAGANADHGLKRTPADKHRAVMMVLNSEDGIGMSARQVAEIARVSPSFATNIINNLPPDQLSARTVGGKVMSRDGRMRPAGGRQSLIEETKEGDTGTDAPAGADTEDSGADVITDDEATSAPAPAAPSRPTPAPEPAKPVEPFAQFNALFDEAIRLTKQAANKLREAVGGEGRDFTSEFAAHLSYNNLIEPYNHLVRTVEGFKISHKSGQKWIPLEKAKALNALAKGGKR